MVTRNEMSKKIATEFGVPVVDLNGAVISEPETPQEVADLQFKSKGSKRTRDLIASRILERLEARQDCPLFPPRESHGTFCVNEMHPWVPLKEKTLRIGCSLPQKTTALKCMFFGE